MKATRKILSAVLCVFVLFCTLPAAEALEVNDGTFIYMYTNNSTELELSKYIGSETEKIAVPSSYLGLPVTSIAANAFAPKDVDGNIIAHPEINEIIIPSSVRAIGDRAFYKTAWIENPDSADADGCIIINGILVKYLGNASVFMIPSVVDTVNYGAFENNTSVTSVTVSDNVKAVLDYAFYGCVNLKEISFSDSLSVLGASALRNTGIERITIPSKITVISERCFASCKNLKTVTVIGEVSAIEERAFSDCSALEHIYFDSSDTNERMPDSLLSIGKMAFSNCYALTKAYLGRRLMTIDELAFAGCKNLKDFYVPDSACNGKNAVIGDYALGFDLIAIDETRYSPTPVKGMVIHVEDSMAPDGTYLYKNRSDVAIIKYAFSPDAGRHFSPLTYATTRTGLLGDIVPDGKIKAADARALLRIAAELDAFPDTLDVQLADLNYDGKQNTSDARLILRLAAGLDTSPEIKEAE